MININTKFICQPYVLATIGLPTVLVQRPDGTYVGIDRHRQEANNSTSIGQGTHLKILVRSPSGDEYLQPRMMRDLDSIKNTTHLAKALKAAGLPQAYANCDNHRVPPVISQTEDELFVPGVRSDIMPERIFVERSSPNRPSGKGSFTSLKVYRDFHSNVALTEEQSGLLGLADGASE